MRPLYSIKPSLRKRFMKKLTRERVVPIISDYLPSPKHAIKVMYSWNRDILDRPDCDTTFDAVPNCLNNDHVKLLSTAWRWNPKSTLTNEVRFGFNLAPATFDVSGTAPASLITGTS